MHKTHLVYSRIVIMEIFYAHIQGFLSLLEVYTENLCKKDPGKKFLEKKPGNKNSGKKSEFYQVLGKNVTGNKFLCF